ncbi:amidohydrolase family protein [Luminiphilus sp.]|nr:amidohydrolase family protein [Luminiphilus sp.]
MRLVLMSLGIGLFSFSCSVFADASAPVCEHEGVQVFTDFQGGNVTGCEFSRAGKLSIEIAPEDEPINTSPWYAFRLEAEVQTPVPIVLDYGSYKHRYTPDLSIDGIKWQTYPQAKVSLNKNKTQAGFSVIIPAHRSLVIAAQPLLTSSHYATWLQGLSEEQGVSIGSAGQSIEGRRLWRLTTPPKKHTLLLLGRQHPPETTGAIALMSFVERLFEDDVLARRFRDKVGILLYPVINPDGTDRGYWRHNFQGKDLNRDWGPFTQPESRAINFDVANWLGKHDSQLVKVIDFHSTYSEVFYTQPDRSALILPNLLGDWLSTFDGVMKSQFSDFEIRRQTSKNPQVNAAKHYFFTQFGVSSTTLEIGDDTDLAFVKAYGRVAAEAFMSAYFDQQSAVINADIVFRGGLVVDGTGTAPFLGDVAVTDGHITMLTRGTEVTASKEIDITGKVIAPGFIDIHTHARVDLVSPERALMSNYLTQGVTTVVIGNDGDGATRIQSRFDKIFKHGAGTNVAQLVGHGALRRRVMDDTGRPATQAEIGEMKAILAEALDEGAMGLSTGLFYADGSYAATEEVIELAKVAAAEGAIYESHIRAESSRGVGVHAAVDEVIEIARGADIAAHIAHIKVLGKGVWGQAGEIVERVREARAEGLEITADQYPWVASSTQLKSAVVSKEYQLGGIEALRKRLSLSDTRATLLEDIAINIDRRGGPNSLLLVETEDPQWSGLRLDAIAAALEVQPAGAAARLITAGQARVVSFNMTEADIKTFMKEPWVATSSDGTDGHPRKFGSFPRKYSAYVRDSDTLSIAKFVRASSGLPADILGLGDRGYLATGMIADVLVLDPERYQENASFTEWNRLSSGVEHLMVNGEFAIFQSAVTGVRAGVPLRRREAVLQ